MKTDAQLKHDVTAELGWDPVIKPSTIGVAVKDGVVTVSGHLDTYAQKRAVEKALKRVQGVKALALELDVKLAANHKRNDTDIAEAAEHALKWQALLPANDLRVTVANGFVTVEGQLDWEYQRRSVDHVLRNLKGVTWLNNLITIKERPAPANLQERIRDALTRQAVREANKIEVEVKDGTVTLRGHVHSWQERDATQGAVWSAPGVQLIANELKIA